MKPLPNLRWRMVALLFFATVINYVDRQTLTALATEITTELGIDDQGYALIANAFLLPYLSMYIFWGIIIDRWGTRLALSASMIWWSVANSLHALTGGLLSLGIMRALLGVGESGNFLAAEKAISEWFPPTERGTANGLVQAAAATGAVIAVPLVVLIYHFVGWRFAFVLTGAFGFVWLAYWRRWYWIPSRHPRVTAEETRMLEEAAAVAGPPKRKVRWVQLLAFRQSWGLFLGRVVADPLWWFYLFWLPKYLREGRGIPLDEMALLTWMPFLTADIGGIAGGWLSGKLIARGHSAVTARKWIMLPAALIMPLGLLINATESTAVAVAIICVITFAHMAWKTNLMTMTNDVYPTSIVGSVSGLVGLGSGLGGFLFQPYVGHVVQNYSYAPVFATIAFLHPVAFLIVHGLVRRPIPSSAPPLAAATHGGLQ